MPNEREKISERLLVPLPPSALERLKAAAERNHLKDGTMGRVLILRELDRMELGQDPADPAEPTEPVEKMA